MDGHSPHTPVKKADRRRGIIAYGIAILVGAILSLFQATLIEVMVASTILTFVLLPWIFMGNGVWKEIWKALQTKKG